jgi:SAM-dependent methyltransferase
VLELGSLYLPGYEARSDLRPYFPDAEYVGCDLREGLGVDRIEDAEKLSFPDRSFGTVLMFELLEHLAHPDRAIAEARRVLRDGGLLALSVPFDYRLHGFPSDYWRFTPSGIHTLLWDFSDKVIFALGPRWKPAFVFAVAAVPRTAEFDRRRGLFEDRVHDTFRRSRQRGYLSAAKGLGRELGGLVLGRARMGAAFFDPGQMGGYVPPGQETP